MIASPGTWPTLTRQEFGYTQTRAKKVDFRSPRPRAYEKKISFNHAQVISSTSAKNRVRDGTQNGLFIPALDAGFG